MIVILLQFYNFIIITILRYCCMFYVALRMNGDSSRICFKLKTKENVAILLFCSNVIINGFGAVCDNEKIIPDFKLFLIKEKKESFQEIELFSSE